MGKMKAEGLHHENRALHIDLRSKNTGLKRFRRKNVWLASFHSLPV